jgi:hypothetical protein
MYINIKPWACEKAVQVTTYMVTQTATFYTMKKTTALCCMLLLSFLWSLVMHNVQTPTLTKQISSIAAER